MTVTRAQVAVLAVICVLAVGGALAYFGYARSRAEAQQSAGSVVSRSSDLDALMAGDHVVFRSTALDETYGRLSVVALTDPAGPRASTASICERVYATAAGGVCLTADRGIVTTYGITDLDARLAPTTDAELAGPPSRARMSADGTMIASTVFVSGHSYSAPSFSTQTIIRRGTGDVVGDLEDFATTVDGRPLTETDRNFWGVTFVDDDDFFATAASASAGKTWLVRGSVSGRAMTSIRTDAECPSISPDRTRVAYKTRQGNPAPGQWSIAVLDLATGTQTVLAERRSVDDQVEWLDDHTVLYALPDAASEATSDVWQLPADGTGSPTVFIPQAMSPAVVRMSPAVAPG
jgi:hypothetical protein